MAHQDTRRVSVAGDETVLIRPIKRIDRDTVRIDLRADCRWRYDVALSSGETRLVSSWNKEDELADLPQPDWLEDALTAVL